MKPHWFRAATIIISGLATMLMLAAAGTYLVINDDQPPPPPQLAQRGPLPAVGANADNPTQLRQTMANMGRKKLGWNNSFMTEGDRLNTSLLNSEVKAGVTHHIITLEIGLVAKPRTNLRQIAGGRFDRQLDRIGFNLAKWQVSHPGHELIIRPLHEANGNWYPWGFGQGHLGNTPQDFKKAWYHVRGRLRASYKTTWFKQAKRTKRQRFTELAFFWCPNGLQRGETDYKHWFPGDTATEYVGEDTYNRNHGGAWMDPTQLRATTIDAIRRVAPRLPYIVGETGTSDNAADIAAGRTKAQWFNAFGTWLREVASRKGIVAVCYFDYDKRPNRGGDWRIFPTAIGKRPASPGALASRAAFRQAVAGLP